MKSLLKYASILSIATLTMLLTGCNRGPNFDITLENGDDLAIESDAFNLTNQEVFELVAGGYLGWVNPGMVTILDWVDAIILADIEIDEDRLNEERQEMEDDFSVDELQEILFQEGFDNLDDYFENLRLGRLREQAILNEIDIDEEDIRAAYQSVFVDEEAGDDFQMDDEQRELIIDGLRDEYLSTPNFGPGVVATLRSEAGLIIHSNYFAAHYENFLEGWTVEDIEVEVGSESAIVASIDGHELTVDEFFDLTMRRFALSQNGPLFSHLDLNLLQQIYNVDNDTIRDEINEIKLNMLTWFYPQMEAQGLNTEQEIFNFFHLLHLQNLAFDEIFDEISHERLLELYDQHLENINHLFERSNTPDRGVRHILIHENEDMTDEEARELAEDLIAQLQAADPADAPILFIEFALEYSEDGHGDLGHINLGDMVPEFEAAAFALGLDEFSTEVVETEFGYHLIYVYYVQDMEMVEIDPLVIPEFEEIEADLIEFEFQRLRNDDRSLAYVMFNMRANQNFRFHNEELQSRYMFLREQTNSAFED